MPDTKNIVLAGMPFDRNLGDQAIYETTKRAVQQFYAQRDIPVKIRTVDIGGSKNGRIYTDPRLYKCYKAFRKSVFRLVRGRPYSLAARVEADCRRAIEPSTDAVIFVGGAMLKFRQAPVFHEAIELILRRADMCQVPVMFSGVGVEGYDEASAACLQLKQSVNRPCVKVITTRDDLDTLRRRYILDPSRVRSCGVSDAACSLAGIYPPSEKKPGVIGLGVARDRLFLDYGSDVSGQTLLRLYAEIYRLLTEKGYRVRIFDNGALDDQKAVDKLLAQLRLDGGDKEHVCPRPERVSDLAAIISSCQAVVATRLHTSIIAYSYGVPFVGLVWNDKQRFFGAAIGHPERFLGPSEFQADRVVQRLLDAMEAGPDTGGREYKQSNFRELWHFLEQYAL